MSVNIIDEYQVDNFNIDINIISKDVIDYTINYFNYNPADFDIDIFIVDNNTIKDINKNTRNIDSPTDVLSFPYINYIDKGIIPDSDFALKMNNNIFLGEIIISKDKCILQAEEYNHSIEREYAFLVAHSMLHLFGYDHIEESEEKEMIELQDKILRELNYLR